jgi:hypothetical protein
VLYDLSFLRVKQGLLQIQVLLNIFACFFFFSFASSGNRILYRLQFSYSLFCCGTDAEIFGNLMILASAVANFPSSVNESFTLCSSVKNSGKLAKILAAKMSSVTISIPALL